MVVFGLFAWGAADIVAQRADRVEIAAWSIRCAGALAIAGGQLLFALVVLPSLFLRQRPGLAGFEQVVALVMGLLALLALVAGGSLAVAAGW